MIFVDTGAWFALAIPSDADHRAARIFLESNREPLISTDYVVDELLTLLRIRRHSHRAAQWLDEVYDRHGFQFIRVNDIDFDRALTIYKNFADKFWSFTDCTSFAVMERLQVSTAFAFDEHFRQFGGLTVVPAD